MYSARENAFLRAHGIRLLPIARQTAHVKGDGALGVADAKRNVDAIFEALPPSYLAGADPAILVYLDVETDDPLAADYYEGWSTTLLSYSQQRSGGTVSFRPALYAGPKRPDTWAALRAALARGCLCYGAWIARYYYDSPIPHAWDDALVTPEEGSPVPLLAWQYWASADDAPPEWNFDSTLINPAHADVFLDGLAQPPP
jgi:hypothetical protein